ncbi:MAG: hypothetical protein PXY39_06230 [archaeon]|nr:hypothetical protein [archaeon]
MLYNGSHKSILNGRQYEINTENTIALMAFGPSQQRVVKQKTLIVDLYCVCIFVLRHFSPNKMR